MTPPVQWRPDGTGVGSNGDCGGDIQCGDSYSVRFVRDDMPGSLVTITHYPVKYNGSPREFLIQRQTEWMVCEDPRYPGDTEIWSTVDYDDMGDVNGLYLRSARAAEQEARRYAEYTLTTAEDVNWNGQPR